MRLTLLWPLLPLLVSSAFAFEHPEPAGKTTFTFDFSDEANTSQVVTVALDQASPHDSEAILLVDRDHAAIFTYDLSPILNHVGEHPFVVNAVSLQLTAEGEPGDSGFELIRLAAGRTIFEEADFQEGHSNWRGNSLAEATVTEGQLHFARTNSFRHAIMDTLHGVEGVLRMAVVTEDATGCRFVSAQGEVGSRPELVIDVTVFQEIRVFPSDARLFDITQIFGAQGDGVTDDTDALNAALGFAGENMLYLPVGTYRVTGPLRWPEPFGGKHKILIGEHRDRVIIRLDDAAAAFQDAANPVPLVWTGNSDDNANGFGNSLTHLTLDVGADNPGANGIAYQANNRGVMRNVRLVAGENSGAIGLDLANDRNNGPCLIQHVRIDGFDIGIRSGGFLGSAPWPGNQNTLEHILLVGQRSIGFINHSNTVSARSLVFKEQNGPAVRNELGHLVLVDTLAYGNDLADEVAVSGDEAGQLLVRDLMSHGYGATLETTGASFTRYVKEWSSDPVDRLFADSQAGTMDLYFEETPMVRWSDPADWFNISNLSTAEIQAAIDAGTRTLYLPAGSRVELDAPLYFRQDLERFVGMGNSAGLFGTSANSLVIDDSSAEAMIFEFLENGDAFGETVSNMLHIAEATPAIIFQGHIVGLRSLGAGPIFIDGLEAGSRIHPFTFAGGGHVYARSYNNEVGDVFTEVRNATEMVILGYKTEQPGPVLHLSEGSRVEVLGAHIFPVRSAAADPMIISTDAEVTFSFFEDLLNEPYATLARETRQGETRLREREGLGNAGVTRFFPNRGSVSALFSGQRSGPYYTPRPLLQGALIVDDWETFGSAFWYQPVQGNPAVDGWSYHPDWGFIWIFRGGIENVYLWQGDEATWRYTNETLYPWSYHYALDEWQWR